MRYQPPKRDSSADYRREAAACLQVAERMSVHADRAQMMEMAQRWLQLAKQAETSAAEDTPKL